MKITENNNIYFKSRNPVIRDADAIARHVNNLFPRVSTTKLMSYNHYAESVFAKKRTLEYIHNPTRKKLNTMRWSNKSMAASGRSDFDKISHYIDLVRESRVGNCGESAFLCKVVAACNGIKNTTIAAIFSRFGDVDHSVLYVKDKKPYVIDPWLGFADYPKKSIERYICECNKFMGFSDKEEKMLSALRRKTRLLKFVDDNSNHIYSKINFSDELIEKLLQKYPELKMTTKKAKN